MKVRVGVRRTRRGITCGSLREVKRISGRRAGGRGGGARREAKEKRLTEGEGATAPDEREEEARKKERQGSGTRRTEKCS